MVILRICFADQEKHNISLVVMAPFPELSVGWSRGPALIPGARLAAREINRDASILPNFTLNLIESNSGCSTTSVATISFVRDIFTTSKQVVGIIGPGCSAAALRIANLTSKYEVSLIHITPSATSPELEDESRNTTFATISSALSYVEVFVELIQYANWTRIATLQDEARVYFKQTHSEFMSTINRNKNIEIVFTGNMYDGRQASVLPLQSLRESLARVIVVFAGTSVAAQMLCYAYHNNMLFPNYQFMFHDRTMDQLITNVKDFETEDGTYNCTEEEMRKATNGVILNTFDLEPEENDTVPLLQKTYGEYMKDYQQELEDYNGERNETGNPYSNSYHDAVWAMAIALHNASENGLDLYSYKYNKNEDTRKIIEYLKRVNFTGVSGPILFRNKTRSTISVIDIKLIRNGTAKLIGTFDRSRGEHKLDISKPNNYMGESIFTDDDFPREPEQVHAGVGGFIIVLALLLIMVTALLQLAHTFWYKYRSIKATSPNLGHLVYSGCYLFGIGILVLSFQEIIPLPYPLGKHEIYYSVLCNAFTWCFILGYTLIFGTVCVKIWRVYRLFKHFQNKSPGIFLSDNSLIIGVILMLLVDIVICTTWSAVDPWVIKIKEMPFQEGNVVIKFRSECTCTHITSWIIAIAAFKGILALLLVVLSILNRRIKRKDFQHTRKINIMIYGITMLAGVGLPLLFLLKDSNVYVSYVILCILLKTTIVLCCLTFFLPPIFPVLKIKITGTELEARVRKLSLDLSQRRASISTLLNNSNSGSL